MHRLDGTPIVQKNDSLLQKAFERFRVLNPPKGLCKDLQKDCLAFVHVWLRCYNKMEGCCEGFGLQQQTHGAKTAIHIHMQTNETHTCINAHSQSKKQHETTQWESLFELIRSA